METRWISASLFEGNIHQSRRAGRPWKSIGAVPPAQQTRDESAYRWLWLDALADGADVAIKMPAVPVLLTVGREYAQADMGDDETLKQIPAPFHLSSAAILVCDGCWLYRCMVPPRTAFRERA
jgi:hypothetical protein